MTEDSPKLAVEERSDSLHPARTGNKYKATGPPLPIPSEIAALNAFSFALFPLVTSERGQWLQGGLPFPTFIVGF